MGSDILHKDTVHWLELCPFSVSLPRHSYADQLSREPVCHHGCLAHYSYFDFLHLIFWHFLIDWNCSKLLTVALIISHDLLALASSLKFCIFFSIFRNSGWSLDSSRLRLQISPHTPAARTPCCARCIFDKHFDSTTHTAQNPKKDERVITFDGGGRCWWGWWWRWWSSEMRGLPPNPWMESGARGGCCLPLPIDLHPTLPITGCTLPITASRGTGGQYCFLVHSGIFSVRHGGLDFKGVEHFFLYSYWEQINSYLTLRCSKPTNGWFRPEEQGE